MSAKRDTKYLSVRSSLSQCQIDPVAIADLPSRRQRLPLDTAGSLERYRQAHLLKYVERITERHPAHVGHKTFPYFLPTQVDRIPVSHGTNPFTFRFRMIRYAQRVAQHDEILLAAGADHWKDAGLGKLGSVHGHVQADVRSEEHTSELQSRENLVCRL